jgi:type VI secretion system protein ImpI
MALEILMLRLNSAQCLHSRRLQNPQYSPKRHMQIQLDIINRDGLEKDAATSFIIGGQPQVIGRGSGAGWVLPDASRFLSSSHCRISPMGNGFDICVLSANGIVLNGKALGKGEDARLAHGDRLELGPYILKASFLPAGIDAGDKTVLLRRSADAYDKTVIARAPKGEGRAAPQAPQRAELLPRLPAKAQPSRAAHASRSLTAEFVQAFAAGARMDPDSLAGKTDHEFAREIGGVLQRAAEGISALSRSARELRLLVASREKQRGALTEERGEGGADMLAALFSAAGSGYQNAEQAVADMMGDLQAHDAAVFHAMQAALFRLLNDISPVTIESETGSSALRPKRRANWKRYAEKWERLSHSRENGMLDVFLEYFRDAYDDRMGGH